MRLLTLSPIPPVSKWVQFLYVVTHSLSPGTLYITGRDAKAEAESSNSLLSLG